MDCGSGCDNISSYKCGTAREEFYLEVKFLEGCAAFLLSIMRRILSDEFQPSTVTEFHELNSDILSVVLVGNHFRSHCTFHSDRILLIQIISVK